MVCLGKGGREGGVMGGRDGGMVGRLLVFVDVWSPYSLLLGHCDRAPFSKGRRSEKYCWSSR